MFRSVLVVALMICFALLTSGAQADRKLSDLATTETLALITRIEESGATFVRNGSKHSSKEAAEHLGSKVKRAGKKMTAEQFISKIGSKSSSSGEVYLLILPDGQTVRSEDWLVEQLAEIRGASPASRVRAEDRDTTTTATREKPKKAPKKRASK